MHCRSSRTSACRVRDHHAGRFGNRVKPELSRGLFEAVRDVYGARSRTTSSMWLTRAGSTQPQLEHVQGLGTDDVQVTVNVPAGTGDWFGGWEGNQTSEPDKYATVDGTAGRMVELIQQGEPAVFLCHWPGLYCQGQETGFQAFQRIVTTLNRTFPDVTRWMKLSAIARYWAAKGLTSIARTEGTLTLTAPFACSNFTLRINRATALPPTLRTADTTSDLQEVQRPADLTANTWHRDGDGMVACWNLAKGTTTIPV